MLRLLSILTLFIFVSQVASAAWNTQYKLDQLPLVKPGFKVQFVAKEPELMHEVCMTFDEKGRLFCAGGAQFRWPKPNTPKDKIKILIDKNGDGVTDEIKIFAEGFNCIQALAWKGKDLWVCHAPAVTVIRDLDGDDVADEFVDIYTDLGPLRHGLHGFNWGPDGKLYMTQGNNTVTKKAPKVWRDLMHVESTEPEFQKPRTYTKATWKAEYLTPYNDESEGGIIRCDNMGENAEIWSRGMRNPWDMAFDTQFNFLVGDNDDGPEADRVFHAFYGSHWGKRHAWNYTWTGETNPAICKSSALFPHANGSAVGTVFYNSTHFPEPFRNGFFMGDSDGEKVYFIKPTWNGAQMEMKLETFAWTDAIGKSSLFMPTDVEVGPDGALYVVGWGSSYGSNLAPYYKGDENVKLNEGRIFRIWHEASPLLTPDKYLTAKRNKPYKDWTLDELMEDMGHQIPVWRINAQDEIVRRGKLGVPELVNLLNSGKLNEGQATWTIWAIGRIDPTDATLNKHIESFFTSKDLNLRLQAIRIAEFRTAKDLAPKIAAMLSDTEARVRAEAANALWHMGAKDQFSAMQAAVAQETDRVVYYNLWRGMQELSTPEALRPLLKDPSAGVKRAALLALAETGSATPEDVLGLITDKDPRVKQICVLWLGKLGKNLPGEALAKLLDDSDVETRKAALQCLSRSKQTPEISARIKQFLAKSTGDERVAVVKALAQEEEAMPVLIEELGNENINVRQAAIDGILKFEKKTQAPLLELLPKAKGSQLDGVVLALSVHKKLDWKSDEAGLRALLSVMDSKDPDARRAALIILKKANNMNVAELRKLGGEIAAKAGADSSKEVRADAEPLLKKFSVAPATVATAPKETTMEQALALLPTADAKRGRDIFFRPNTPGCYNCHVLEGKGVGIGPDLSDIGKRADGKNVAESIFDPNKVIIEGFQPTLIKTKDGKILSGMIRDEGDEALWVWEANGKKTEIFKRDIGSRKSLNVSYMPDNFPELMTAQESADLIAYLLTLKAEKNTPPKPNFPGGKD